MAKKKSKKKHVINNDMSAYVFLNDLDKKIEQLKTKIKKEDKVLELVRDAKSGRLSCEEATKKIIEL